MGKLVVSEFMTLDGVFDDPGGAEGTKHGGWSFKFKRGPAGDKFKFDELIAADSLLLGRVTYEGFAEAWPTMQDEQGFAEKMNKMPKHVVSASLGEVNWNNSSLLPLSSTGDIKGEVTKIKQAAQGDILVFGSGRLVCELMRLGLVDELRIMLYPIVLGQGRRLFESAPKTPLKLSNQQQLSESIVILTYGTS